MANNPYWQRISAIADRQREKGIDTYGKGIEENPAELRKRIDMALEELVDLGMYLCWVDDKLTETAACDASLPSDIAQKYAAVCKERDELRRRLEQPEINIYDEEEIHHNCTVQILRNSVTGAVSVGWCEENDG